VVLDLAAGVGRAGADDLLHVPEDLGEVRGLDAWKTMPATPRDVSSSSVWSVTYAVLIANSRSGAGCLSLRLPLMTSNRPTRRRLRRGLRRYALELGLEPLQRRDPLLHGRVCREERATAALAFGGKM